MLTTAETRTDALAFDLPGTGPDAALFLHGLSGSPFEMSYVAARLNSEGIRCRGPILPGHGGDPLDLQGIHWEDWVEAGRRELDALAGARRTWVIGCSMGALIACALAHRQPGRLDGLALLSPALRLRGLSLLAGRLGAWALLTRYLPMVPKLGGSDVRDREMRLRNPGLRRVSLRAVAELIDFGRAVDRMLPEITAPALIIAGARDHTVALSGARRMARRLPGGTARLVVLRDSCHLVGIDVDRLRCATEVARFFTSLG